MAKRVKTVAGGYSARVRAALAAIKSDTGKECTHYQADIIAHVLDGTGHAIVRAVPGSGKSTTLEYAVRAIASAFDGPARPSVLVLAFNKEIATAMAARLPYPFATVKTLNAFGFGAMMRDHRFRGAKLDTGKTEMVAKGVVGFDQLTPRDAVAFAAALPGIKRVVGLFKGYGFGAMLPMPTADDVAEIAGRHDVDLPEPEMMNFETFADMTIHTYERSLKTTAVIDFDDQLIMPILHNMPFPRFGHIFVDESQDLNAIQLEMVRRIAGKTGRVLMVGDEYQAIYGFRGAMTDAMERGAEVFGAASLPLSISWRCPRAVVAKAAEINPAIEAAPNAAEGTVKRAKEEEFLRDVEQGDMVLCRTTAPLVQHCFELIKEGKKAYVKGRDIGAGLKTMLDKVSRKRLNGDIYEQISTYMADLLNGARDAEKAARLAERLETLLVIAENGCTTANDVKMKIDSIFAEDKPGVGFSTIHKAKGLEAARVWILHPELLPHPMAKTPESRKQETNLKYVAITRAMDTLVIVNPKERRDRKPA